MAGHEATDVDIAGNIAPFIIRRFRWLTGLNDKLDPLTLL